MTQICIACHSEYIAVASNHMFSHHRVFILFYLTCSLEVARRRVERRKGSTNQMSYTIAPDAEIPNSIYRDSGHQTPVITLEFQDIALLIAKVCYYQKYINVQ